MLNWPSNRYVTPASKRHSVISTRPRQVLPSATAVSRVRDCSRNLELGFMKSARLAIDERNSRCQGALHFIAEKQTHSLPRLVPIKDCFYVSKHVCALLRIVYICTYKCISFLCRSYLAKIRAHATSKIKMQFNSYDRGNSLHSRTRMQVRRRR